MGSTAVGWGKQHDASPSTTAAVMVHSKLTSEAGAASAAAAAQQAKIKLQKKHHQELLEAALTPPQQRTQAQIDQMCDFLSTVHLLRSVQPTALKSLAHAMIGQSVSAGDIIYKQGDIARHLFVLLSGEVVMYEQDNHQSTQDSEAAPITCRGSSQAGPRLGSSTGLRTQQSPRVQRAASPNAHKPGSPRRPGSTAGGRSSGAAAAASTGGSNLVGCDSAAGQVVVRHSEVRRVKPREAFGEDEVTAGGCREQTAVSVCALRSTFGSTSSGGSKALAPGSTGRCSGTTASSAGGAVAAADGLSTAPVAPTLLASGTAAAAAADARSQCVLLVLSAEDYGAALEGRLTSLLEEKVMFLSGLPAMKGLSMQYLRTLAHCFHQVNFEPREVVVWQGDVSDCMYVLKSGQVCILIDPSQTLAETNAADIASDDGARLSAGGYASSSGGGAEPSTASDLDTKKLVQVCLLGTGSIIGDMSVRESGSGPPRRSATVVALTELVTYKVPLKEFKRRMPADILEGMRQVANQKLEMNDSKAQGRALANGRDGQVLLGGVALPECVLQGKGLRALLEASQQRGTPVGGLMQALELCVTSPSTRSGKVRPCSPNTQQQPAKKWFVSSNRSAQEVEGFMDSLTRNGFLAAPPNEFLALMTDWHSARTNNTAVQQQVPPGWLFPLPIPPRWHQQAAPASAAASAAALAAANSHLHPAMAPLAPLAHAASCCAAASGGVQHSIRADPSSQHCAPKHQPAGGIKSAQSGSLHIMSGDAVDHPEGAVPGGDRASAAAHHLASQPLLSSPTSLLAALSLDQYVQQHSPLGSPAGSRYNTQQELHATPTGGGEVSGSSSKALHAAAVAREAAHQLLSGGLLSPKGAVQCRVAGGMAGRGQLLRGPLAQAAPMSHAGVPSAGAKAASSSSPFETAAATSHTNTEPSVEQATIKAAALFRPGSPICIARCGSPLPNGQGSTRVAAAAEHAGAAVGRATMLEGLAPNVAVVTGRSGKQELTFHGVTGPA